MTRQPYSHTTLLIGEPQAGLATALRETARQWCGAPDAPCGRCAVCRRVLRAEHPDVHVLDRGGAAIKIDDVRELVAEEHVRPYEAPFKVYIIVRAQTMNAVCQNSLLKTLEEPDGDTRFYLIAEKTDSLLPTILSRCAIRRIAGMTSSELARRLQEDGATAFCAQMSAMLADGSLRRAQEIAQDAAFFENGRRAADALCTALCSDGGVAPLYAFTAQKQDALCAITWWRAVLRDMLCLQSGADAPLYFLEKPKQFDACAARLGARGAANLCAALDQVQMQIEGNVNVQLAADGFFFAAMKEKRKNNDQSGRRPF